MLRPLVAKKLALVFRLCVCACVPVCTYDSLVYMDYDVEAVVLFFPLLEKRGLQFLFLFTKILPVSSTSVVSF